MYAIRSYYVQLFGFEYTMEIATKPDKAIGDDAVWEIATQGLKDALTENNLPYTIDEGGGAFYGPKIDVKITDALGRKWQCGTIQVDFNLPQRFEVEYVAEDNTRKQPVMLHRAVITSYSIHYTKLYDQHRQSDVTQQQRKKSIPGDQPTIN